jgi:TolB-like protein/DNA-binding winged helix-turn-helix (wHTH) protein
MSLQADSPSRLAYDFADYRLEPARRSVTRADGSALKVAGKPFDVLLYLVQRAGDVVDRGALMEAVWQQRVVEENNVNQVVAGLRRVLGPQHIATVAGRGYQFVTPVRVVVREEIAEPAGSDLTSPSMFQRTRLTARRDLRYGLTAVLVVAVAMVVIARYSVEPSNNTAGIAVLPCANLSPDASNDYFAAGIHDELLNRLAQIRSLRVISKSSVLRYAVDRPPISQIGAELGVGSVMECGVRYSGDQFLLTVELIDTAGDEHVWSQSYSGDMSYLRSIYAIQAAVAVDVANELRVQLLAGESGEVEPTDSRAAYELYLQSLSAKPAARQLELLGRALDLDPRFVDAWIRKAGIHMLVAGHKTGEDSAGDEAAALEAAHRALEIDPSSARAHNVLAVHFGQIGEWLESEREWLRATALNGGSAVGSNALQKMSVGHIAEAVDAMEKQMLTDPTNEGTLYLLMIAHEMLGDKDARHRNWVRGKELSAGKPWVGDDAEAALRLAENDLAFVREYSPRLDAARTWSTGVAHLDSPAEGLAALQSLYADPTMHTATDLRGLTTWALYFGDSALALEWFRQAVDLQATSMLSVWLPLFEPLRREPGFKDLLREQGMPEYWAVHGWPAPEFCRPAEGDDFDCS